ncbi:MAG: hypothetical protein RI953_2909 [Pseudomonadota bacterium]|jgi:hypothetical protein
MTSGLRRTLWGFAAFGFAAGVSSKAKAAAWWYEQAERLQNVSATLLDGPPISEPVPNRNFIAGRMLTSLLPKASGKVGDKEEKVPSAPVHGVPTLVAGMPLYASGKYSLVGTGWAGVLPLPVSIAKVMGINASLTQFAFGASGENMYRLSSMILTTSVGFQYANATIDGAITAADAKDNFNAATTLFHVSQGVRARTMPLWANAMFLVRRSTSKFSITKEQTEFVRTDKMADAQIPISTQLTIGATYNKNIHFALSEYIVPDRLIMPRLSVVYQYIFNNKSAASSTSAKSSSGENVGTAGDQSTTPKQAPAIKRKKRKNAPSGSSTTPDSSKKGESSEPTPGGATPLDSAPKTKDPFGQTDSAPSEGTAK